MATKPSALAVRVVVPAEREDEAVAVLWELGTLGVHTEAPGQLLAYFSADVLDALREALGGWGRAEPAAVPDVDWVARFREQFRGFTAGSFRIVPAWDIPADRDARTLVVDPGQAFGTGTHETTRLCLGWLESVSSLGRVLDYGCGTALLAMAALRLGATSAVGVDIDPDAVENARDHLRLNDSPVQLVLGDGASAVRGRFDTVVANVTGPMLLARADEIAGLRATGGRLILSGLLENEADTISQRYEAFGTVERRVDGEWAALLVKP